MEAVPKKPRGWVQREAGQTSQPRRTTVLGVPPPEAAAGPLRARGKAARSLRTAGRSPAPSGRPDAPKAKDNTQASTYPADNPSTTKTLQTNIGPSPPPGTTFRPRERYSAQGSGYPGDPQTHGRLVAPTRKMGWQRYPNPAAERAVRAWSGNQQDQNQPPGRWSNLRPDQTPGWAPAGGYAASIEAPTRPTLCTWRKMHQIRAPHGALCTTFGRPNGARCTIPPLLNGAPYTTFRATAVPIDGRHRSQTTGGHQIQPVE